jgi:hypothetical protein
MTPSEAIEALKALDGRDKEENHIEADQILLETLWANGLSDVADAYVAARLRIKFYYA